MEKLKKMLDFWIQDGKPPGRKRYPHAVFAVLWNCYNELRRYRRTEFIQADVKELLAKCKIPVKPCGIGWEAVLP